MKEVFITRISSFLPNNPVSNDEMEGKLGYIKDTPSKSRAIVLRNNGIKSRYYAIDDNGNFTHNNIQLTHEAIKKLVTQEELQTVDLLACGTSSPDQMMPSHAVMVHGEMKNSPSFEVVSPAGVCCSGMHALKYAFQSIKLDDAQKAICTGSEYYSRRMQSTNFEEEVEKLEELQKNPYISFEKDFLRWMLSDGAAALLLENKPSESGLSFRVEWIEMCSYASEFDTCMYMGADKNSDGTLKSYLEYSNKELIEESVFSLKQDVKLLKVNIVTKGFEKLATVFKKYNLAPEEIDWFLPHMSSEFFRKPIAEAMDEIGLHIPMEKWFTNLSTVGNVGSASAFLMLEELAHSALLKKGQKILLGVPESARFSYAFCLLTVC